MSKIDKGYLMIGGTLLLPFMAVTLSSLIFKEPISHKSARHLLIFAGFSIIGGFVTSNMIKKLEIKTV